MKSPYDILIRPILSEKTYDMLSQRRYAFEVVPTANKTEIKLAVEQAFGVKVQSVNTMRRLGKLKRQGVHVGRRPSIKKAYVTLEADSKGIEAFDGLTQ
ncbi:MAG: 50S ribosomal protein L23 [Christensenellales bacterium]|jgi:large subunit ribosomal protein L23